MNNKPKILVLCDYYLPGYKSGGGMRTIVNMIERLHEIYDFRIVTRDHDGKLDKESYKTVKINEWNTLENAQVYYLSKDSIKISKIRELILEIKPDLLYANSFFSTLSIFAANLKKLGLIPNIKMIVSPCGELSDSALNIKSPKKGAYIFYSNLLNIYKGKDFVWKASSEIEEREIFKVKKRAGKVFIASDLPPRYLNKNYKQENKPLKEIGTAKMIFLSRFVRIKNFKWLLENLKNIKGNLEINVYGPIEDVDYWKECLIIIDQLPENIKVESKGGIPYQQTSEVLLEHHFFISSTLSENFGHVFLESLAAGSPIIISNRTPWLDLEKKGIGWDLALENPQKWINVINCCISMNNEEYTQTSSNARGFAINWLNNESIEKETEELLEFGLSNT